MNTISEELLYVQYGAGNEAIPGWLSFDASPTLRIQKISILGKLLQSKLNCVFDADIQYGDIVKGLPLQPESVDGLFCSHILEHLSYADFHTALRNSYCYLRRGGRFRIIVPDLAYYIDKYQQMRLSGDPQRLSAAYDFCKGTGLGLQESRRTIRRRLVDAFRGSGHRWMWDYHGLVAALSEHGFVDIKRFEKGICEDEMFLRPERDHQFGDKTKPIGLAIECKKP